MDPPVVGRESELALVETFLDEADSPGVLLVEGEPGIGKSTMLSAATAYAIEHGYRVLSARPAPVETTISFAAVGDLLEPILDEIGLSLPDPQRNALEIALHLSEPDGPPPPPGAIAFALLSAFRAAREAGRLLVSVDDVQWLDQPSAAALFYVLRRLRTPPLRFLLAQRVLQAGSTARDLDRAIANSAVLRLPLGPLSIGAVRRLLRQHGSSLPRPVLHRIHAASGGNPFYALEIAQALRRRRGHVVPGDILPVPHSLAEIVREHLSTLPHATEKALQVAALLAVPTIDVVTKVLESEPALVPAIDANVVEIEGDRIVFSHPLLASGLAARIEPTALRGLHRRIASATTDPEERGRHLALASDTPDERTASTIEEAAELALRRGAPGVSFELLEHAIRLTPASLPAARIRRTVAAAEASFQAGDTERSVQLLDEGLTMAAPGRDRADVLWRLGTAGGELGSAREAMEFYDRALTEAEADQELAARIHRDASHLSMFVGDLRTAREHGRRAAELAEKSGTNDVLAEALAAVVLTDFIGGYGVRTKLIERALELEQVSPRGRIRIDRSPTTIYGSVLLWSGNIDVARVHFERSWRFALERGDESNASAPLFHLVLLETLAGNWERATSHLELAQAAADETGINRRELVYARALLDAHRGLVDDARFATEIALAESEAEQEALFVLRDLSLLGSLELSCGDASAAHSWLERAVELAEECGHREPGMLRCVLDNVEALAALKDLRQAQFLLATFQERAKALDRTWALALSARAQGILEGAGGDLPRAISTLERASVGLAPFRIPLERGRTLLALGTAQLRARRRRDARETLRRALTIFEHLGAGSYAQRTREELGRIGGRVATPDDLTAAERRVAELVAEGMTNKEVAARLVVSVHTVEASLTSIYRKLGVRSRTEMARRLPGRD